MLEQRAAGVGAGALMGSDHTYVLPPGEANRPRRCAHFCQSLPEPDMIVTSPGMTVLLMLQPLWQRHTPAYATDVKLMCQ